MAGGQERLLRTRIRTVESTKKITRAMELIAASRMARAQARIAGARPYLHGMERVLNDVASDGTAPERLIGIPESPEHVAVVAIVSDRGLCGGYNAFVLRTAERLMKTGEAAGRDYTVTSAGKKAIGYFRFRHRPIAHTFTMPDAPTYEHAREIAATVVPGFLAGEFDLVELVSTRFVSAGIQTVATRQILPLPPLEPGGGTPARLPGSSPPIVAGDGHEVSSGDGDVVTASTLPAPADAASDGDGGARSGYFEFEPPPEDLLALLVPRYAEAALYAALLEASASEHIARQRAMSAATENADELIKNLRRVMNRARQDTITSEIMEIVGGAEALRQGSGREAAKPLDYNAEERSA
ncbi:MAG: ATP synthase F1 subunit gamma [Acidimicrobiales bacterium]|jgi:F-type H+-transporting ATPase subunit gamma